MASLRPSALWGRALVALSLLMSAGCGDDDDPGGTDAGTDGGSPTTPADPAATAEPALTCPTGWRETSDVDGVTVCDPFPAAGPMDCGDDAAHWPGEASCTRIGRGCSMADDWADDLPAAGMVVYVRAGASGGDGTRMNPYGTVVEAMRTAPAGAVIAVARGTYDEAVQLRRDLTLWGACTAETTIASTIPTENAGSITVVGPNTTIRNLRVGGDRPGIRLDMGSSTMLDGVVIDGAAFIGLFVSDGGVVTGGDVMVRDTRASLSGPMVGRFGRGIEVADSANVTLARAMVVRNREAATTSITGSTLVLEDSVIRGTQPEAVGLRLGTALGVQAGGMAELTRSLLDDNSEDAISGAGVGSSLTLTDVVIQRTRALFDGSQGRGLEIVGGASAVASEVRLVENRDVSVVVRGMGTSLAMADVLITDTNADGDGAGGRALVVEEGAEATGDRVSIARARDVGLLTIGASRTMLSDLTIRDVLGTDSGGARGRAVNAEGATVTITRGRFERAREVALFAMGDGTSVTVEDGRIEQTLSRTGDGRLGRALSAQTGATIDATRLFVETAREVAVAALGEGGVASARDVVITSTRPPECAPGCDTDPGGNGVVANEGGAVSLERFVVANHEVCGVMVGPTGQVDLSDGVVERNAIGLNVQADGYDVGRLMGGIVVLRDNGVRLDETVLPTPEPAGPIGTP